MAGRTDPDVSEDVTLLGTQASASGSTPKGDVALVARGSSIGRYVVLERIGAGGMGVVYLALDPDLGRKVAIKLVRGEAVTDGRSSNPRTIGAARLLREAQAMARVRHVNVITVYDVGTHDDSVFIAMEYLAGGTLQAWQRDPGNTWSEIVAKYRAAGAGLVAAHAAGLVHRDFKPDNVLLAEDGRVCVVDFGISTSTQRGLEDATSLETSANHHALSSGELRLTRTGALVGTPAYMAPEQHSGGIADAASDQFALCVALYEALYHQRPYEGGNAAQLAANVIEGRLRKPPESTKVPAWLFPVIARGLAVEPASRHADVAALLDALADDPAARRRRRWWIAGAATLGLASIGGVAMLVLAAPKVCTGAPAALAEIWNDAAKDRGRTAFEASGRAHWSHAWDGAARALDDFGAGWIHVHTSACRATAVLGEQSQDLLDRRMMCLERRRRELESVAEILGTADDTVVDNAAAVVAQLGDLAECSDTAGLLAGAAIAPHDRAEAEAIRAQLDRAKILRTAARDGDAAKIVADIEPRVHALAHLPITAEWTYARASADADAGRHAEAIERLYEAARLAAASGNVALEPTIWLGLLRVVGTQQDRPLELPPIVHAAEIAVVRAGDKPTDRAGLATAVGMQELGRGELVAAETRLREAVGVLEELRGPDHHDTLEARELLALTLHAQRRYDEAEPMLLEVAAAVERTLQATHPRMGTVIANLGRVQAARGDLEGARVSYERAIVALEAGFGPKHQVVATGYANLATTLRKLGRYDEAQAAIDRALAIEREVFGQDSPRIAANIHGRAQIALARGKPEQALADYRTALSMWEATLGKDHPRLAYALVGIGKAQLSASIPVDVAGLERALALRSATADVAKDDLAEARFVLARALRVTLGDPARSRSLAEQARATFAELGDTKNLAELDAWLATR